LTERCVSCHGPKAAKGGLRLDSPEAIVAGGDSGPAVVPGNPNESQLLRRIAAPEDLVMPPSGGRLPYEQIGAIKRWIESGAPGLPVKPAPPPAPSPESPHAHWSFQPVQRPALPAVRNTGWAHNPIDAFVLAELERRGFSPAPEADRRTLYRRLSLDLLGLPPSPAEVVEFVNDPSPDAYPRLVDRLLASPHFGERWGRHWLDLARYGDSDGLEHDHLRPYAHRFRDWVIKAVNDDLPYDRFTVEQLAGDLLPDATADQRIAAGFHRNTLKHYTSEKVFEEYRVRAVKDRVHTTGTVWLGLTFGCAECHTHKFDPITHDDYHRLFAIFNNASELDSWDPTDGTIPTFRPDLRQSHVMTRGDHTRLGKPVSPGTPGFLPPLTPRGAVADRLDLARWLTDPAHPLTARVAVNHVWQHLFGVGLVASADDFGVKGERPSHPALLDWLASEFVAQGWSRKKLITQIVLSNAYRQASAVRPELAAVDPANRLLGRQNRFRVEAEVVYDSALQSAGLLNTKLYGQPVQPAWPKGLDLKPLKLYRLMDPTTGPDRFRRAVYVQVQRTFPHPLLAAFDAGECTLTVPTRDRSNTPQQSLFLLNDPTFVECTKVLGRQIGHGPGDVSARIAAAFEKCLSRPPTAAEMAVLVRLWERLLTEYSSREDVAAALAGDDFPGETVDAAAGYGVAAAILNLDEFLTRE
jgi:hypothetical protein